MPRYFIELAYKGSNYSGFQVQQNAATIQSEVESAFEVLHRRPVTMTGSSRTDSGVHAIQNYFHFDTDGEVHAQMVYKMNAILPPDIVIRNVYQVAPDCHARFDARSREYEYRIHRFKSPFLQGLSYHYPYRLDIGIMQEAASIIRSQTNFFAFSKTNTQVRNFNCNILRSEWTVEGDELRFHIEGNRFLRGMVRLLTASLLRLGRGRMKMEEFGSFFHEEKKCGFSVPSQGLYLVRVVYPENYFPAAGVDYSEI